MYSNNFDSESEGTSPPAGFTNIDLANFEVDDAHSASTPHSCRIKAGSGGAWKTGYFSESYSDSTEKLSFKGYLNAAGRYYRLSFADTDAIPSAANMITLFYLTDSNDIKMYDATVLTDTGFNYAASTFKLFEILFNFDNDTYDAWYDGDLIADDYSFYQSASSIERVTISAHGTGPSEWWIDDIQFGEEPGHIKFGGNVTLANGLTLTSGDAKIEFDGSGTFTDSNSTKQKINNCIISGSLTLETDLTAGDFKVRGALVGATCTIKASGDVVLTGSVYTYNTSTIVLNGSNEQTFTTGGVTLYNLIFDNFHDTEKIIISGDLDINGTFLLTNGQIDMVTNNPNIYTAGNVTWTNGCTIVTGVGRTATWTFDGTATYDDNNTTPQNIGDIAITAPGIGSITLTLASSIRFIDITIGSNTTFASGNQVIYCEGYWVNSGTFTYGTSHVNFEGTTSMSGMVGATNKFYDLTVKTGCTLLIATLVEVGGTMTGCFTADGMPAPGTLYITNDCTVDGTFQVSPDQETDVCP